MVKSSSGCGQGYELSRALEILSQALVFGIEPSLEGVTRLCQFMGNPQDSFDAIQIAGTNGKTSTSRFIAAILHAHHLKTGLYTSPELVRYPERVEVDGCVISDELFAQGIEHVYHTGLVHGISSTEFELLTAGALSIFADQQVDVVSLEVGLGGRWDATSVVSPRVAVVTGVALDHCKILGDTTEEIAREKAAIITRDMPAVLGASLVYQPTVQQVFLERAHEVGAPVVQLVERTNTTMYDNLISQMRSLENPPTIVSFTLEHEPCFIGDVLGISVKGIYGSYELIERCAPRYQAQNMALAVVACEAYLGRELGEQALKHALRACRTPGRFDVLREKPLLLVDACHNPDSVAAFMRSLAGFVTNHDRGCQQHAYLSGGKTASREECVPDLLLACLADKDAHHMIDEIDPWFYRIAVTQTPSPRALEAAKLKELVESAGHQCVGVYPDVEAALKAYEDHPLIACGSITLAGEIMRIMQRN